MKRILVTGVSGFLGRYVATTLKNHHAVLGTYCNHTPALDTGDLTHLDLTDVEAVQATCRDFRPDVVVHAAALSDVDACERHPNNAHDVNVQGTEAIAQAVVAVGARLIYISTDQVYDGVKGHYDEADVPQPLMVYGRTKLEGEHRATAICHDTVILRIALLYGWGIPSRLNFVDRLIDQLQTGQETALFIDQYRSPLYVVQAAEAIGRLIEAPEVHRTYNLGGGERINRYVFGLQLCEVFGLPQALLKPVEMNSVGGLAARPADCSLNSAKISSRLTIVPLTVEEGLRSMRHQHGLEENDSPPRGS
jgi:dTDP-4-dehydrorhamnose reductase